MFSTRHETRLALEALTVLVSGLEVDRERMAEAASDPLLLATDAAEALVRDGVPFRDAHERVAESVRDGSFEAPARRATARHPARAASGKRSTKRDTASSTTCRGEACLASMLTDDQARLALRSASCTGAGSRR